MQRALWNGFPWALYKSGFGGCQENDPCRVKFNGEGDYFSGAGLGPLVLVKRTPRHFGQFQLSTLWEQFGALPLPTWLCASAQSKVLKNMDDSLVWMNLSLLQRVLTSTWWIGAETERQAFSSNINVWPHKWVSGRIFQNSKKHMCGQPSQKIWCSYRCKGCHLGSNASEGGWGNTFG